MTPLDEDYKAVTAPVPYVLCFFAGAVALYLVVWLVT